MDQTEQQYIDRLFAKLREAEQSSPPRDISAERYITSLIARHPAAPYYMAQTVIVQEEALKAAQDRIAELEAYAAEDDRPQQQSGGFLGGMFGGGRQSEPQRRGNGSVPRSGVGTRYPAPNHTGPGAQSDVAQYQQQGRGGGFLAGAMQTAVGVAGGVMLGNMLTGMLGGGSTPAQAATTGDANKEQAQPANEQSTEQNQPDTQDASDDGGSWFDFGGGDDSFDI